ncbi:MAG: hypothetical protein HYV78_01955 [Candidatus Wildermuthbacteria bacterium]|nr:hypothetical protein [Candidatus Wildermuthbacteria bacterium]
MNSHDSAFGGKSNPGTGEAGLLIGEKINQRKTQSEVQSIQTPGYTELVDVSGGIVASLSRDDIIAVIDIANPRMAKELGTIDTPAFAEAAFGQGNTLYIADSRELRILKDPFGKPVGLYALQNFWPSAITVENNYVYLVSGSELMILNAAKPNAIKQVSKIQLTGRAGSDVFVKDGYAYVLQTLGGLNIIDVKNREKPRVVKVLPFESHTAGFKVRGNYAYLGRVASTKSTAEGYSQTSSFEIIDITNPASAKVIGTVILPTNITGLDIDGAYAYVIGSFPYRLTPIDIRSPTNPTILQATESIIGDADLQDIQVTGGFAFLADGIAGLRIVDVSNPAAPNHVKDIDLGGRGFNLYKTGNKLYVGVEQKYFHLADARNSGDPKLLYTERFTASYPYTGVVINNSTLYFNGGGARIYDISNPKSPRQMNAKPLEADSIQIQGKYLYSTIGEVGLLIYDVSNPSSPALVSRTPFPVGIPRNVSVDGRWAIGISNSPYSINLFDIADPKKPVAKKSYLYEKYPYAVTAKDGYAYVARGRDGFDILKILSGGDFELVSHVATTGYVNHVIIVGKRAYAVRDGADIYDITNPKKPAFLNHISNRGEAKSAVVSQGRLYIADGYAGVTIVTIAK